MKRVMSKSVGALLCGIFAAIVTIVLTDAFAQDKATKPDGKTIFEQKCLKCHKPEKFQSQHNDRRSWELILSRMERNSCMITEEEQSILAEYLAKVHGE